MSEMLPMPFDGKSAIQLRDGQAVPRFVAPVVKAGTRYWVQEAWAHRQSTESMNLPPATWYAADFVTPIEAARSLGIEWKANWLMPQERSRMTVEVVSVELQSEGNAIASFVVVHEDGN